MKFLSSSPFLFPSLSCLYSSLFLMFAEGRQISPGTEFVYVCLKKLNVIGSVDGFFCRSSLLSHFT